MLILRHRVPNWSFARSTETRARTAALDWGKTQGGAERRGRAALQGRVNRLKSVRASAPVVVARTRLSFSQPLRVNVALGDQFPHGATLLYCRSAFSFKS